MTTYFPILQSRQAETVALVHASTVVANRMCPLVTVVSEGADEGDRDAVRADVDQFVQRIAPYRSGVLAVDHGMIEEDVPLTGGTLPVEYTFGLLRAAGVSALPVVRPSSDPAVLVRTAAVAVADQRGALIRIDREDASDTSGLARQLTAIPRALGLGESDIDVILDFGPVMAQDLPLAVLAARAVLTALPALGTWRHVAIASGAFPDTLDTIRANSAGSFDRSDAALWAAATTASTSRDLDFGDYAIAHPSVRFGGWAPAPNLRYTRETDWYVSKGEKGTPRGNYVFHDICDAFVSAPSTTFVGAAFSWGDGEIARCAEHLNGPGGAKEWRGWATSHHLATVTHRLATVGAP